MELDDLKAQAACGTGRGGAGNAAGRKSECDFVRGALDGGNAGAAFVVETGKPRRKGGIGDGAEIESIRLAGELLENLRFGTDIHRLAQRAESERHQTEKGDQGKTGYAQADGNFDQTEAGSKFVSGASHNRSAATSEYLL